MADNTQLNPGVGGDVAAADDIGGVKYQRVKLVLGDDGVAEGDVSSNRPIPVSAAALDAINAKLPAMDEGGMPVIDAETANLLWRMLQMMMSPMAFDSSLNRMRETAIIESGTITTVTGVTTVTGLTNIDGRNGAMAINAWDHTAWALNVRACIT